MTTFWIRFSVLAGMLIYMLLNPVDDFFKMFFVGFLLVTLLWLLAKGIPVSSREAAPATPKEGRDVV